MFFTRLADITVVNYTIDLLPQTGACCSNLTNTSILGVVIPSEKFPAITTEQGIFRVIHRSKCGRDPSRSDPYI